MPLRIHAQPAPSGDEKELPERAQETSEPFPECAQIVRLNKGLNSKGLRDRTQPRHDTVRRLEYRNGAARLVPI